MNGYNAEAAEFEIKRLQDSNAALRARVAELESALAACIERLEQVSDDSESTSFIESCQPVITQAKVALYPEQ